MRTPARPEPEILDPLDGVPLTDGRRTEVARAVHRRPFLHRLPPGTVPETAPAGFEHYGLWLAFDLDVPSPRTRCVAVFFRVRLDGQDVVGVDMRGGGNPPPPSAPPGWAERLRTLPELPPVSLSGVGENAIGLFAGSFDVRGPALPISYTVQTVVQAPSGLDSLSGTLRVDASFTKGGLRPTMTHTRSAGTRAFTAPLVRRTPSDEAGVRLCMAADIERYSRFTNPDAVAAQERLVDVLARARRFAGIDEDLVIAQESGDGQFALLPMGMDESVAIPRLVEGLRDALAETNRNADDHRRIRIRVALHRGHVTPGKNGWIGNATIAVHRLLDSPPLREALAQETVADFALIVPDSLFTDVIAHHYGALVPESFRPVQVDLPAKSFSEGAWVHVPGGPG